MDRFFNWTLAKEPMNWAIVSVIATLWLLLFHVVMTAFGAMKAPAQGAFAPGTIASPLANAASGFSTPGTLGGAGGGPDLGPFQGQGAQFWTDGYESKYAEDGWTGNS
jgi:hypothetical protein